ncbi:MAG: glycosyltransferase family 9 protein [Alphaproteobacteria bacterium]|nr:glycosyltransferase family 9 protein [Alphaproteobacteria bacterium]
MVSTHSQPSSGHRTLVIQPMVGIGDMVWHKPWLDAMIAARPITLMAKPSAQAAAVMMDHPELAITPLHRSERGKKGQHDGWLGFLRLVMALRATQADEIWILHKSWRYAAAAWLAGIPKRAGYGFGKQKHGLNHGAPLSPALKRAHPRQTVAAFCAQFGIAPDDEQPRITPDADSRSKAMALAPSRPFIIMGVGAADAIRRWSPMRFAAVIARLHESHPDVPVVLCGSPAESAIAEAIITALPGATPAPQCVFDQPVKTVIALHEQAAFYLGNDTSLINIAVATGRPAIRVFASSLPVLDSPLITTFLPPDPKRMDQPGAIDDIDDAAVHAAAAALLAAVVPFPKKA